MRRGRSSGERREPGAEVELVEWQVDGPPVDGPPVDGPGDDRGPVEPVVSSVGSVRPARPRARALRWGTGIAVVLLVVVAANVAEARRDAARAATLEGVASLVAPMPEPLTEVWRVPGDWVLGERDGLLLVSGIGGGVAALDPVSGWTRWTWTGSQSGTGAASDGAPGYCRLEALTDGSLDSVVSLTGPLPDAASVVLCSSSGADGRGLDDESRTTASVVDPATGAEVLTVQAPGGELVSEVVAGGLVLATGLPTGQVRVERWDIATGDSAWAHLTAVPVPGQDTGYLEVSRVVQDVLLLAGEAEVAVSLTTGQEVDPASVAEASSWVVATPLPDGATARWDFGADSWGSGQVTESDGTVRFALPGPVWVVPPIGGPAADVLLVVEGVAGGLLAIDVSTGDELWSLPPTSVVLQVDDVVVTSDGQALAAVRLSDGSTVWEVPVDGRLRVAGVTDGDVVLAAVAGQGGESHLAALDLVDGREVWRTELPPGTYVVTAMAGQVIMQADGAIIALG